MTDAASDFTPNLSLPFLLPAQAQKHVTVNDSLAAIDTLLMASIVSADISDPPNAPQPGDAYLLPASASGDWSDHPGHLAAWADGRWTFHQPKEGWRVWDRQDAHLLIFDGNDWQALSGANEDLQNIPRLGVGTVSDAGNPLSVRGPGALMTALSVADGGSGDFRLALNADAGAHSASVVFQSEWSGRGEIGLTTDGLFALRSSSDGAVWTDAIQIDPETGHIGLGAPPESGQPVTIADLARISGNNGSLLLRDNGSIDMNRSGGGSIYFRARSPGSYLHLGVTSSDGSLITNGFVMRPNNQDIQFGFDLSPAMAGAVDIGKPSRPFGNCYLTNAPIVSSDRRGKTDIETFDAGLELLQSLNPVTFKRKGDGQTRHIGLIAQQVREALESTELAGCGIWNLADQSDPGSAQSISYGELVPVLIDAVNELAERVEALEARGR